MSRVDGLSFRSKPELGQQRHKQVQTNKYKSVYSKKRSNGLREAYPEKWYSQSKLHISQTTEKPFKNQLRTNKSEVVRTKDDQYENVDYWTIKVVYNFQASEL